ncbi:MULTISPECIES: ABC transporter permease [Rhodobacterales]|uniref:ABC transporter permease n=1 Tax=Rhodobacterales TaxID=204455 RepID=UPI0032974253
MSSTPQISHIAASLVGLVLLWAVAARVGADPSVLPSPGTVWQLMVAETQSGELPQHMWATFCRVFFAFSLAMIFGLIIGLALGLSRRLNQWFGTWLVVLLNIPALVVIVLCYLWIGLNEVAAITAVALNKTAMVAVSIREGVHALHPKLTEMARAFRMSRLAELRHVILPQLWPLIASSMRNGLAIIWKIVLVVEFLGRSDGVGFQIHLYFQLFETGYVLVYALSFVVVMLVIEYGVIGVLERRVVRWRAST